MTRAVGEHDGRLWNVTKARAQARKLLGAVDAGGDPVADRRAKTVYQRHEYRAERKSARVTWAKHVDAPVSGIQPASNVRQMRA